MLVVTLPGEIQAFGVVSRPAKTWEAGAGGGGGGGEGPGAEGGGPGALH